MIEMSKLMDANPSSFVTLTFAIHVCRMLIISATLNCTAIKGNANDMRRIMIKMMLKHIELYVMDPETLVGLDNEPVEVVGHSSGSA
jgi:hypothetical protein